MNPRKLKPFIKAYNKQEKLKMENINFSAWLSGIYMSCAIASVLGGGNNYPDQPFSVSEEKENRENRDSELFGAYAAMFNKYYNSED